MCQQESCQAILEKLLRLFQQKMMHTSLWATSDAHLIVGKKFV